MESQTDTSMSSQADSDKLSQEDLLEQLKKDFPEVQRMLAEGDTEGLVNYLLGYEPPQHECDPLSTL